MKSTIRRDIDGNVIPNGDYWDGVVHISKRTLELWVEVGILCKMPTNNLGYDDDNQIDEPTS